MLSVQDLRKKSKEEKEAKARRIIEKRQYDIVTFADSYEIHTNDNLPFIYNNNIHIPMVDPKYSIAFKRVVRNMHMTKSQYIDDNNFPNEKWRTIPMTDNYKVSSYGRVKRADGRLLKRNAAEGLERALSFSLRLLDGGYHALGIFPIMYEAFPELFYHWIPYTHYGEKWKDITSLFYEVYRGDYGDNPRVKNRVKVYFSNRGRFTRVSIRDSKVAVLNGNIEVPMKNTPLNKNGAVPYPPIGERNEYVDLKAEVLLREFFPEDYMMMVRRKFLNFEELDGELWLPIPNQKSVFWSSNRVRTMSLSSFSSTGKIGDPYILAEGSRLQFEGKRSKHLPFSRRLFSEPGAAERALTLVDIAELILRGDIIVGDEDLSSEKAKRASSSFVVYDEYSNKKEYFKSAYAINQKYRIPMEKIKQMLTRDIGSFNGYSVYYSGEVKSKI